MPLLGRRALLGGLLAGAALPPAPALAKLFSVGRRNAETFTLANGLQAIVLPSRRAPIVTQVVVYKVGSADETFGQVFPVVVEAVELFGGHPACAVVLRGPRASE